MRRAGTCIQGPPSYAPVIMLLIYSSQESLIEFTGFYQEKSANESAKKLSYEIIKFKIFIIILLLFSDEEGYGKYLDLHECYDKFINLKVSISSFLPACLYLCRTVNVSGVTFF